MSISLVLTNAGLAAIVNAKNTGTNAVEIVEIGFTQTAFAATAATAAIPGEFARLTSLSGDVVANDTVHLVVRDEGVGAYALRGVGLYLAGGVLFGSYGQAAPIVQKTAESIVLLAIDIKLAPGDAATISFGDTNFLNPPATTERQGVIELATAVEALAGADPSRAITPATLKPLLDALLKLAGGQTVTGNVGFGGAPPLKSVTANSELVIRNGAGQADYRNWDWIAGGAGKGALALRLINDAGTAATMSFLSIDGATGATDFTVQPKVNGAGIWHGGNLVPDIDPIADTVAKRTNAGHLRATWFIPAVGSGLTNSAGYYFYTDAEGGSRWFARSANTADAAIILQRKDGVSVGGIYGAGDQVGLLNKSGAWRFQTRPAGDLFSYSDAGIESQVLLHNRLPVNTPISSLDGSQRLRFTPAGRSTYSTPEAHEFTGGPTYFQAHSGTCGFEPGTGDGASYTTYNLALKIWNGLAFRSFDGAVNAVLSSRTGDFTTKGVVTAAAGSFGGAPAIRPLSVNSESVIRNVQADANYRNWHWLATGAGKGALYLQMLNDAGNQSTFTAVTILGDQGGAFQFATTPRVGNELIWHTGSFDPASKASVLHSHDWAQVTGKPAVFPPAAHGHGWGEISGKPASFPPDAHGHGWGEISGKPGSYPPDPHGHDLAALASSVQSFAQNGYMRIGSLVLQWGEIGLTAGDTATTGVFPMGFPNACLGVLAVPTVNSGINSGASRYGWSIYRRDQFSFDLINDSPASGYMFLAWGF